MMSGESALSVEDRLKIEENRNRALELRRKRTHQGNLVPIVESSKKGAFNASGGKFLDSKGGFLMDDGAKKIEIPVQIPTEFDKLEILVCQECQKEFLDSYLHKHFNYTTCDGCWDNDDKHALITKSEAKAQYLLKDCDLDLRDPPLKYISRKNPHNLRWGEMKLYLHLQVEKRAIEVWGSLEKIEEAIKTRDEKRVQHKTKKYQKDLKALKMSVRSSLYDKTTQGNHEHKFGDESYNEAEDNFFKTCQTCSFVETYEKM